MAVEVDGLPSEVLWLEDWSLSVKSGRELRLTYFLGPPTLEQIQNALNGLGRMGR